MFRKALPVVVAMMVGLVAPALAVNLWSGATGDINFPGLTPTTIDSMAIGQTTPAPGAFTTLSSTSAPSGAGVTALFASPPAIGGSAPAPGSFTTATTTGLGTLASAKVDTGTKTAAATAGAATLNKNAGVITSEAITTAAGATYTLTLTNSTIAAADQVFASVQLGTATTGMPAVTTVTPGAGSVVVIVQNIHASAALNGTIKVSFVRFQN